MAFHTGMNASNDQYAIEVARRELRDAWMAVQDFILAKARLGLISKQERRTLSVEFDKALNRADVRLSETSALGNAVIRQATHEMLAKLVELHPEWTHEVAALANRKDGRGRD